MAMSNNLKYQFLLHFIVLIWGFTGILGDLISLDSYEITFFRTGIAFLSLIVLGIIFPPKSSLTTRQFFWLLGTGVIVGLHWITFFYSVKISLSIAVVCMSASTLFTSFLEPIIFNRKFLISELILSIIVSIGIFIIFGFELQFTLAIIIGLISAFFSALFNVLNGTFVKTMPSQSITKYEMLGGFLTASVFLYATNNLSSQTFTISLMDWMWLLILALVCTTFAFIASIWVMKFVTPFTVSISVNMEPLYTIVIALIIDYCMGTNKQKMSDGFYFGASIIILAIFAHAYLKTKKIKADNGV